MIGVIASVIEYSECCVSRGDPPNSLLPRFSVAGLCRPQPLVPSARLEWSFVHYITYTVALFVLDMMLAIC